MTSRLNIKLSAMSKPTKLQVERAEWVQEFKVKYNRPPTLGEIAEKYKISRATAWETMQRIEKNTGSCPYCGVDSLQTIHNRRDVNL